MIVVEGLEVGITLRRFISRYVLSEGRLIGDLGCGRGLTQVLGKDLERRTTNEADVFDLGSNGFVLNGENVGDLCGISVSEAGDINDDGIADLIVGANGASGGVGKAYVIYGNKGSWSSPLSLSSLNPKFTTEKCK